MHNRLSDRQTRPKSKVILTPTMSGIRIIGSQQLAATSLFSRHSDFVDFASLARLIGSFFDLPFALEQGHGLEKKRLRDEKLEDRSRIQQRA